jgi:glycerol-3-phosphate acyltransferase PlsY
MTHNVWFLLAAIPLAAYVIGATPFGYLIGRLNGLDLRKVGSGNIGATNVVRVLGKKWGYPCFLLDVAKGLLPVLATGWILRGEANFPTPMHQAIWLGAGCGAILGHVFPFYLKFRGGKGVATALGVVLGVWPYFTLAGLLAFALWIAVTLVSRYVSVGSIVAAVAFVPLVAGVNELTWKTPLMDIWPLLAFAAAMCLLIIVRHRANIRRLLAGTENKIGKKK